MKETCLHSRHVEMGALMSPFAGYDMPISYRGIEEEHNAVRGKVGVFDVSHMGEVLITGEQATEFVNHIFTGDVAPMVNGKVMYGMMLYDDGGVVDDLLVYKCDAHTFFLVINASNIDKDVEWIMAHTSGYNVTVNNLSDDYAQLAVQGPEAEATLKAVLGIDASALTFYTFTVPDFVAEKAPLVVSRTGYTGEDGFEIYATPTVILEYWDKLIAAGVEPCGLGCRDTLRFEAGLPLYGDELTDKITPLEAGLGMFAKVDKPEFIGRDVLVKQKAEGMRYKVVGLEIEGKAIARHGYPVLNEAGEQVGEITTGYHSITLDKNIAMALVNPQYAALDTKLQVQVRRKVFAAVVIKKRFYQPKYKN